MFQLPWLLEKCLTGNRKKLRLIGRSIVVEQRLLTGLSGTSEGFEFRTTYLMPPPSCCGVSKREAPAHFAVETIKAMSEFVEDQIASVKRVL